MKIIEIAVLTLLYILLGMFTFGRVCSHVAWNHYTQYRGSTPNWSDGVFIGLLNAPVWPLTLPVWLVVWHLKRTNKTPNSFFFKPPPHLREEVHKHQKAIYEARIAELEREAGIR